MLKATAVETNGVGGMNTIWEINVTIFLEEINEKMMPYCY